MIVGLTYDLRDDYLKLGYKEEDVAEFDGPRTIEAIDNNLRILGFDTERIGNVRSLVEKIAAGKRWDLVFNIAEGMNGFGREAQVPALLEAYGIPYTFSDSLTLSLTLHKGMAKHVARGEGVPTPNFMLVEDVKDIDRLNLTFPLFAKPVAEGTGKGVDSASKIESLDELYATAFRLLELYKQPVLVEEFLPGREFTVGVVGTGVEAEVVGVMEVVLLDNADQGAYTFMNKELCEDRVLYRLEENGVAHEVARVALEAYRCLGCRDAGRVDIRLDGNGVPNFMEVNPLAGLHPKHSDLPILCTLSGMRYNELIKRIVKSALKRANASAPDNPAVYAYEAQRLSNMNFAARK